ncbi:MAG: hypothetical protein O2894_07255 [Planctomycetota bacterium]|nr:hypothetical protein [Planctomycetota bacterium]
MRTLLLVACFIILGAPSALAEERVVLDEWSAMFESGVKLGWQHERIIEQDATPRFVRTLTRHTPVGTAMLIDRQREEVDAKGRVLAYTRTMDGPTGSYAISLLGRDYTVAIRKNEPVTGTLETDAVSIPIRCVLTMRGEYPQGEQRVTRVDLPGAGAKVEAYVFRKQDDGTWLYEEDGERMLRAADGRLVRHDAPTARPHWRVLPATAENAAARDVRDGTDPEAEGLRRATAKTITLEAPPGPWMLRRNEEPSVTMVAMEHPLRIAVAALELSAPMGDTEEAYLAIAEQVRAGFNGSGGLPEFGEPSLGTFQGQRAVEFALEDNFKMEPVEGRAWLVRNRAGEASVIFGFYAVDLRTACAPLVAEALKSVRFEAPAAGGWMRVHAPEAGLTLEIPSNWAHAGAGARWLSPGQASQVAVQLGRLEEGMDPAGAQQVWIQQISRNPSIKDIRVLATAEVEVDGVVMYRTTVAGRVATGDDTPDVPMVAASSGAVRDDGVFVQLILVAFPDLKGPDADHIHESVRWVKATK